MPNKSFEIYTLVWLLFSSVICGIIGAMPEEQLLGFEGAEMKLSCPTADTSNKPGSFAYDWFKTKHNGTPPDRSTLVAIYQVAGGLPDGPRYGGDLAGGRAKLDLDDGSLTIHQLQVSDEHWYFCEVVNTGGNIFLTVNVQPSSLSLIQEPQGQLQENTTVTFTCTIERTKPAGEDLYWMVGAKKVEGVKSQTSNPDGTFKMENVLSFTVNKDYAGTDVQCVFVYTEDNTKTETRTLDVYYRPYGAPSISGDESSYIGGTVTLACDTSNVDASVITEYIWEKVGHGEVARSPTATWQWNVQSLDDAGNFTCQVLNDLGSSDKSAVALLTVTKDKPASVSSALIGGVVGGLLVVILLIFIIFVCVKKRRDPKTKRTLPPEQGAPQDDSAPKDVYAQVDKSKKKAKSENGKFPEPLYAEPDSKTKKGGAREAPAVYSNMNPGNNNTSEMGRTINQDGTVYIEVAFDPEEKKKKANKPTPAQRNIPQTQYARVDFNRSPQPARPEESIYE